MITKGAFADFIRVEISCILAGSDAAFGGRGTTWVLFSSPSPCITSAGRSTNEGPPLPYHDVLYAVVIDWGIESRVGLMAILTWGVKREMASISWKAPLVTRWVSLEPARRSKGKAFAEALPMPAIAWSTSKRLALNLGI